MSKTEYFNYIIEERLPEIKTLIIGVVFIFSAFIFADTFLSQFVNLKTRSIIYLLILFSWIVYWFLNRFYLPRNKKDKVGIVIAIFSENEKERQKLKADFISKLKSDFQQEGILKFSEVIFLKNHFAKRIKDSNDPNKEIDKINKKIKAHFYIWGDVKKRQDGDDGEKYFLNFNGYVFHGLIPNNLSNEISKDFSKVLPYKVNFLEKRSFRGFEASAKIVHLATKYIVGYAAFVSGDAQLAFLLHDGLKDQFNILKPLPLHIQDIKNRIPLLISDELLGIARWHFENNRNEEAIKFINKSLIENNNNYGAWLFKAMINFLVDKNIEEASKSVRKAEKYSKNTFEWRYSKAFLYFWKENYQEALKTCQKIKKQSYQSEKITLQEVRIFNLDIIKENKVKAQLYFWIGYLSYFKENNLENALHDFEKFEELADNSMDSLKQKSSSYLQEIRRQMKIKDKK